MHLPSAPRFASQDAYLRRPKAPDSAGRGRPDASALHVHQVSRKRPAAWAKGARICAVPAAAMRAHFALLPTKFAGRDSPVSGSPRRASPRWRGLKLQDSVALAPAGISSPSQLFTWRRQLQSHRNDGAGRRACFNAILGALAPHPRAAMLHQPLAPAVTSLCMGVPSLIRLPSHRLCSISAHLRVLPTSQPWSAKMALLRRVHFARLAVMLRWVTFDAPPTSHPRPFRCPCDGHLLLRLDVAPVPT